MKINVGCGWECRDGWLNVDNTQKPQRVNYPITPMDATKPWPYEENLFEAVLSEHMIEHLHEPDGFMFLQEAFRTLRPGGVIRVTCPRREFIESFDDNHPYVTEYCREIFKREPRPGDARFIRNRMLRQQGHVWVPTTAQLVEQVKRAGFFDVKDVEFGTSSYDVFNGIELEDGFNSEVRKWETVCVEGVKK